MSRAFRLILVLALLTLVPGCGDENTTNVTNASSGGPAAGTGVALGGNTLHFFSPSAPGTFTSSVAVSGLDSGYVLATIDYRPATLQLYGVAMSATNAPRLYVINASNGTAAAVGGADFTTAVAGTRFGSDFNPVVDRIRFVTDTGFNMRANPNNGLSVGAPDTALNPGTPAVSAIAYTNNTAGATLTTLFGIDGATLVRIGGVDGNPTPNGGLVTTIGALGVTPDAADIGFDIAPSGVAYAAIAVGGISNLYTINLATGAATLVGRLGPGAVAVRGLAIAP